MCRKLLLAGILLFSSGCATSFSGVAKVPNGPAGCREKCSTWGMELAGMVAMGEYSDGCICQVAGGQKSATQDVAGASAAVAGVEVQRQEFERKAAAQGRVGAPPGHR